MEILSIQKLPNNKILYIWNYYLRELEWGTATRMNYYVSLLANTGIKELPVLHQTWLLHIFLQLWHQHFECGLEHTNQIQNRCCFYQKICNHGSISTNALPPIWKQGSKKVRIISVKKSCISLLSVWLKVLTRLAWNVILTLRLSSPHLNVFVYRTKQHN